MGSDLWHLPDRPEEVDALVAASSRRPQMIFKYSDRCHVSYRARMRLEASLEEIAKRADPHLVDVIRSRGVALHVTATLGVPHASPQVILIEGGRAIWTASHGGIRLSEILAELPPPLV